MIANLKGENKDSLHTLRKMIKDLEKSKDNMGHYFSRLSGGEKTKVSLLQTLLQPSDLYILDEPTNNLDVNTLYNLIQVINNLNKTILIISHDREFLNKTIDKIYELKREQMNMYVGNYDSYKEQKNMEDKTNQKIYDKQQASIKQLKKRINERQEWYNKAHKAAGQNDFLRSKAKKHVNTLKSTEKKLERLMEEAIDQPEEEKIAAFNLLNRATQLSHLPNTLLRLQYISKVFNQRKIIGDLTYQVNKGDRIGIMGDNRAGKSTLMKLIVGKLEPSEGQVKISPSVKIGYFSQELENLNGDNSILEEVMVSHL